MNKHDLIDRNTLFEKVTNLYRCSTGDVHVAYRNLLDFILDIPAVDVWSTDETEELKAIIKRICTETTTDHYGDATVALTGIDKILDETRCLWDKED